MVLHCSGDRCSLSNSNSKVPRDRVRAQASKCSVNRNVGLTFCWYIYVTIIQSTNCWVFNCIRFVFCLPSSKMFLKFQCVKNFCNCIFTKPKSNWHSNVASLSNGRWTENIMILTSFIITLISALIIVQQMTQYIYDIGKAIAWYDMIILIVYGYFIDTTWFE